MRKIFSILLVCSSVAGYAQSHDTTGTAKHVWVEKGGTSFQKFLELPLGPSNFTKVDSVGCIYYDTLTGELMVNDGSAWSPVSGSGGGVIAVTAGRNLLGGVITSSGTLTPDTSAGHLATKTDLLSKLNTADTAYLKRKADSVATEGYVTHSQNDTAKVNLRTAIAAKGAGSVTSIIAGTGLSGGTITTSGTIAMTNVGTAGTNGTATQIPVFVTDAQGRVTASANTTIGTLNQNTTGSAATLTTARNIYGNAFNGSSDVGGTPTFNSFTTNGALLYTNGSGVVAQLSSAGSAHNILHGGTPNTYSTVDLASADVTGVLPSGNLPAAIDYVDVSQSITKSKAVTPAALTDASTIAVDLSTSNNLPVTLGGNRTLGVPTNIKEGQAGSLNIWQDGTGSRTLAFAWCYNFSGAAAPTLTTNKYALDKLVYQVDYCKTSSSVTATNAAPGVFTWTAHGLVSGEKIQFSAGTATTPALNATYWVNVTGANTFNIATSLANLQAGTFVTTSGISGSLTATALGITIGMGALDIR